MGTRIGAGTRVESPEPKQVSNTEYSTTATSATSHSAAASRDMDGVQARAQDDLRMSPHSTGPGGARDALLPSVLNYGALNSKPQERYELLCSLSAVLEKHPAAMESFLESSVHSFR